jgi:NAD(P)H-dependent FMN reductase
MAKPKVMVITGSIRPGRSGDKVGKWVVDELSKQDLFETAHVDLGELALPLSKEPKHPKSGVYSFDLTKQWSEMVSSADGFILVTPEYNHGYPAGVKNALDYLYKEWNDKPIGFVSYGVVSGSRAVEQLRQVVLELLMVPLHAQVLIPLSFAGGDVLANMEAQGVALENMAAEMSVWLSRLASARETANV